RDTLTRANSSLDTLDSLVRSLRPGVHRLAGFAPVARQAVDALAAVAPQAAATLRTGTKAVPEVSALLGQAQTFVPRMQSALNQAAPQLACVRPYTPEIVAFPSLWSSFSKNYDASNHYARVLIMADVYPGGLPITSKAVTQLYPG